MLVAGVYIVHYRWRRTRAAPDEDIQHEPENIEQGEQQNFNPWDDYDPNAYGKDNPRSV